MLSTVKFVTWTRILARVAPGSLPILLRFLPARIRREHAASWEMAKSKVLRRRQHNIRYTDLMTNLEDAEKNGLLHLDDLTSNAPILVLAGSETTATSLSGTTYYLLKNPEAYRRLADEIRTTIKSHEDIDLSTTNKLHYLTAAIEESLRMYSPANSNHPRVTPPEGAIISGQFVPGNTLVGIPHYACFRSPTNFTDPDHFAPERFLRETNHYSGDKREASQPFHVGPRNCIGRK
jgi:cytochrome P450